MRAHFVVVAAMVLATIASGCMTGYYSPGNVAQQRAGIDGYADRWMRYHASFVLDCAPNELTRDDLGRLPHSEWYRHTYSGCGQTLHYWTDCTRSYCSWAVGLEERASVDFDCDAAQISVRGVTDIMRASGCGQTAVYQREDEEWIMSAMGVTRTDLGAGTTVPVIPPPPAVPILPPALTTTGST